MATVFNTFLFLFLLDIFSYCHAQQLDTVAHEALLIKVVERNKTYPEYARQKVFFVLKKEFSVDFSKEGTDFDNRLGSKKVLVVPNEVLGFQIYYCCKFGSLKEGMRNKNDRVLKDKVYDDIYLKIKSLKIRRKKIYKNEYYYNYAYSLAIVKFCKCKELPGYNENQLVPSSLVLLNKKKQNVEARRIIRGILH